MRPPAAEKKRPTLGDCIVFLAVIALALISTRLFPSNSGSAKTATVTLDGKIIAEYDLSAVSGTQTVEIKDCQYPLWLEIESGRIRISHSDCPNGDCVKSGWADRSGEQIICLPNRLIVSLSGKYSGVDAVTGG